MMKKLSVTDIAHHRNGISGIGFYIVLFDYHKMAIIFPELGAVSVLDRDMLSLDMIEFGQNSWRGDVYEHELREVIKAWEDGGRPAFGTDRNDK